MRLENNLYRVERRHDDAGVVSFDICLNADSFIYKAHFPGEPVTPGVCIVQISAELLEKCLGYNLLIVCLKNVKFLAVIKPADTPSVTYTVSKVKSEDSIVKAQIEVSSSGVVLAKVSLEAKKKLS